MTLEAGSSGLEFYVLCRDEVEDSEKVEDFLFLKSLISRYELESYKNSSEILFSSG